MAKPKHWRESENKAVTAYWLEHYGTNDDRGLCSLCGNSGVIDTRQTAISAVGVNSGRVNWCICPNGQAMRITTGKATPNDLKVDRLLEQLRSKSFNVTWGPDNGRPAGYYVSIPNYKGGEVVPLAEVESLLRLLFFAVGGAQ